MHSLCSEATKERNKSSPLIYLPSPRQFLYGTLSMCLIKLWKVTKWTDRKIRNTFEHKIFVSSQNEINKWCLVSVEHRERLKFIVDFGWKATGINSLDLFISFSMVWLACKVSVHCEWNASVVFRSKSCNRRKKKWKSFLAIIVCKYILPLYATSGNVIDNHHY